MTVLMERSQNRRVRLSDDETALLMRSEMTRIRVHPRHDRRARGKQGSKIMAETRRRRLVKVNMMLKCNKRTRNPRQRRSQQAKGRRRERSNFLVRNPSPWHSRHADFLPVSPENTTGLRRGKRLRYEPLEWWRCEKVVYGRRDSGKITFVPTIKEIVRIPKDTPKPLGAAHKARRGTSRRKKTEELSTVYNPEEGWDDKTATNGTVIDWFTGNEVSRRTSTISVEI